MVLTEAGPTAARHRRATRRERAGWAGGEDGGRST
jgi:hypothetical protein